MGDVMVDVSVHAGALATGGDVHGEVRVRPGGAGANAAVWAAREGAHVRLYGRVGGDLTGRLLAEELARRGVDARLAVDAEARTGAMLVVHQAAERSMVADRGANGNLAHGDLPERLEAGAVLLSGYLLFHPGSEEAARAALDRARAALIAVDAASWPLLARYGVGRFYEATVSANVLLANQDEAKILEGGAEEPRDHFPYVCRKLGVLGADLRSPEGTAGFDGPPLAEPVDPTGAGDAFDGVFLTALAGGASHEEALRRACEAGRAVAMSPHIWPED